MSSHSAFSPSGFRRKRLCPGSHRMSIEYPQDSSSPEAIDGTHSHTLLEREIKLSLQDHTWNVHRWIGTELSDHEGTFVVDKDRADRVAHAVRYVSDRVAAYPNACGVWAEVQVNPGSLIGHPGWSGTADLVLLADGLLEVIDYKDGGYPVYPDDNDQIDSYKLGALAMLYEPPKRVVGTIIQPKDSQVIKVGTETTSESMLERLPEFAAVIEACERPDAPRIPGGEQCKFCPGKIDGRCPEFANMGGEMIAAVTSNVTTDTFLQMVDGEAPKTAPEVVTMPTFPRVDGSMSDQTISQVLDAVEVARQWFKEVEAEAIRRFKSGRIIPDYKVVKVAARRKWNPDLEQGYIVKKLQAMKIPKSESTEVKLVSFTKVLKHPGLTDRQIKRIKEEFLVAGGEDHIKLVPASAKGEALEFVSSEQFIEQVDASMSKPEPEKPEPEPEKPQYSFL